MRFELHIGVENDAFQGEDRDAEIARILKKLARRLEQEGQAPEQAIRLFDANGNRVGFAVLTEPINFTEEKA